MSTAKTKGTNITKQDKEMFDAIRNSCYENFALFSCFMNGEATCAIVALDKMPDGEVHISPMFVRVTPGMKLTDHDGIEPVEE